MMLQDQDVDHHAPSTPADEKANSIYTLSPKHPPPAGSFSRSSVPAVEAFGL